jgi:hypothetical protein
MTIIERRMHCFLFHAAVNNNQHNTMSTAHRSIARLPLHVYTDLILGRSHKEVGETSPAELRRLICSKLKKFPRRATHGNGNGHVFYESITTVGQLLTRISKLALLKVLDPLLTFGTFDRKHKYFVTVSSWHAWIFLNPKNSSP